MPDAFRQILLEVCMSGDPGGQDTERCAVVSGPGKLSHERYYILQRLF